MISNWKVSNFKAIRDETELELRPFTIFAGANSSGKSTFVQTVLLVAQTLAHKVGPRSIVLNGALTSLGQFDDLKSNGNNCDQISIGCTFRPARSSLVPKPQLDRFGHITYYSGRSHQVREINCAISFDGGSSEGDRDFHQIHPRLVASSVSCEFIDDDGSEHTASISVSRSHDNRREQGRAFLEPGQDPEFNEMNEELVASLGFFVELDDTSLAEIREEFASAQPIGCVLRHFVPERIVYKIDWVEEEAGAITSFLQEGRVLRRHSRVRFTSSVMSVLREILRETAFETHWRRSDRQEELFENEGPTLREWLQRLRTFPTEVVRDIQETLNSYDALYFCIYDALRESGDRPSPIVQTTAPRFIDESCRYLDDFFTSSLKYLGPLRDSPKPLYPLVPSADPNDIGLRGENTASVLELHKNKRIRYLPSRNFESTVVALDVSTGTLEEAVMDWLDYLGVASGLDIKDQGKLGHELKVRVSETGNAHDLTHVGVGVSQVLPILVMCLLAENDSTLVLEQPELHLHPKVQTLLGDFFLSVALSQKQCIVETHSEYIIDRLRYRIAAAPMEAKLEDKAMVYFVEKQSESSTFKQVEINQFGAINDWPEGFFDQSQHQAEQILFAAAKKRRSNRATRDG